MPNMWHSDGTPAVDPEPQQDYIPQPRWEYATQHKGWVGVPITAAEDFTQADMEDLI